MTDVAVTQEEERKVRAVRMGPNSINLFIYGRGDAPGLTNDEALKLADEIAALQPRPASSDRQRHDPDEDGFGCEYDEDGSYTLCWPDGRWLVCFPSQELVAGKSPTDPNVKATKVNLADLSASTVRAEALEEAARVLEDAIGRGYSTPVNKIDKCQHDKFGWEDCIACYDDALTLTVAAIRALAEPARGEEG